MAPGLREGEFVLAVRPGRIRRGSVVLAVHPHRPRLELVKRVRGVAGDEAQGRRLRPGEVWLEGDDPTASTDSRSFGPVPTSAIRGVVVLRYWPLRRLGRPR